MKTSQILEHCREVDRGDPYVIVICFNAETLADGYWDGSGPYTDAMYEDAVTGAGAEVVDLHDRYGDVHCKFDSIFRRWHGGRHDQAGKKIGDTQWGYRTGWVVTHEENPPQWLCLLIDDIHSAMTDEATRIGEESDVQHWKAIEPCTGSSVQVQCVETGEIAIASVKWTNQTPHLYGQPYRLEEWEESCFGSSRENPVPGTHEFI